MENSRNIRMHQDAAFCPQAVLALAFGARLSLWAMPGRPWENLCTITTLMFHRPPNRRGSLSSKYSKMSMLRQALFWPASCFITCVMETLALLTSLPDNAALVLVGIALIVLASILKKRLISPHADHGSTQGPTIEQ